MHFKVKLVQIGNSVGMILPKEVLAAVDGQDLHAVAAHLLDEARDELAEREALIESELGRRESTT